MNDLEILHDVLNRVFQQFLTKPNQFNDKNAYEKIMLIMMELYKDSIKSLQEEVTSMLDTSKKDIEKHLDILNSLKEGQTVLRNDLPVIPGNKTVH